MPLKLNHYVCEAIFIQICKKNLKHVTKQVLKIRENNSNFATKYKNATS